MQKKEPNKNERASVLIIVLVLVSAISFLAFEAMRNARYDAMASSMLRMRLQDDGLFEAGLNLAKDIIGQDDPNVDTLFDKWNNFDEECEKLTLHLQNSQINGVIEDEGAKFPINALAFESAYANSYYEFLVEIFTLMSMTYGVNFEPRDFADAVLHWVSDEAVNPRLDAAYANKTPSYSSPHRPMEALNEFLLLDVPGVSADDMKKLFDGTKDLPGIVDLFSTYTRGPININTADKILIFAATKSDDMVKRAELTDKMLRNRTNPSQNLNYFWFERFVKDLEDVSFLSSKFTYRTNYFRVKLNVEINSRQADIVAILKRVDFGASYVEYATY